MYTHNETFTRAPLDRCLRAAADVERWPAILPHYRRVRYLRKDGFGRGRVEMAAWRRFGPLPWPVWWVSEMTTDPEEGTVRYRHVDGITRGMDVVWSLEERPGGTRIVIVHVWDGPRWPLIGGLAARRVIGPWFIHVVAGRTLAGIRAHVEAEAGSGGEGAGNGAGEGRARDSSASEAGATEAGADARRPEAGP